MEVMDAPQQAAGTTNPIALDHDEMTIEEFAAANRLTTRQVWKKVRQGKITARTQNGKLVICQTKMANDVPIQEPDLPPLPVELPVRSGASTSAPLSVVPLGNEAHTPEVALLIDHLSLAKEENREIISMTQASLQKVTSLTDSIVAVKDELIASKNEEIAALREKLAASELDVKNLRQEKEDLEMLVAAMRKER